MSFIQRIVGVFYRKIFSKILTIYFRVCGIEVGNNVIFYGFPCIVRAPKSRIVISNGVVLCSISNYTALGVNHPVQIKTLAEGAKIIIRDNVGISGGSICSVKEVLIGAETMLGANVVIADTDFHQTNYKNRRWGSVEDANFGAISIGKNVFLGTGSIVLKGVSIGDNSVVAAGSVVVKVMGANIICGGIPAKIIGELNE
jgi:acetyltransferase-like isoleucine patch superfamily enzyme